MTLVRAMNNEGGTPLEIDVTAENDDGAFLMLAVRTADEGDDVIDLLLTDPADVDALLEAVQAAVLQFRSIATGEAARL